MKKIPPNPPFAKGGDGGAGGGIFAKGGPGGIWRVVALAATAALLAGCGTLAKRAPEASPSARSGGYYLDDGPGANPPANLAAIPDAVPRVEPLNRAANNPYVAFGRQYVPLRTLGEYRERGVASWYGRRYHAQRTSSGEPYDMYAMTAAHPVLPIPSYARVTNVASGASVVVRINDRGPFHSGRVIDLSYAAAWKLGFANAGNAVVDVESIKPGAMPVLAARQQPSDATPLPERTEPAFVPVAAESGGVYLQLGAFSARENAEGFRDRIRERLAWLDRAIEVLQRDGLFRVHLGPYRTRAEATGVAERIRSALDLQAVLVVK